MSPHTSPQLWLSSHNALMRLSDHRREHTFPRETHGKTPLCRARSANRGLMMGYTGGSSFFRLTEYRQNYLAECLPSLFSPAKDVECFLFSSLCPCPLLTLGVGLYRKRGRRGALLFSFGSYGVAWAALFSSPPSSTPSSPVISENLLSFVNRIKP